ncbi:hypothetical protein FQN53_008769 [Emmonsiellopsis sp. PD_33]|nr:hypothetical protein FQN53_008769 [Emmonsiellopsis sp. PD_33]
MGMYALAAPAEPLITAAPKLPLIARQDGSFDFASDILPATFGTDVKTVTIHHRIQRYAAGNTEIIEVTDKSLLSIVEKAVEGNGVSNPDTCPLTAGSRMPHGKRGETLKDHTEQDDPPSNASAIELGKRDDAFLAGVAVPDPCWADTVRDLLRQMNDPDAPANQLIVPGARGGVTDMRELAPQWNDEVEVLVAFARQQAVPNAMFRMHGMRALIETVNTLLLTVAMVSVQLEVGRVLQVSSENFAKAVQRHFNCDKDENAPICQEFDCLGGFDNLCTMDPNKGCRCYPLVEIDHSESFDPVSWDAAQNILLAASFPNNPPKCNGLGSRNYVEHDSIPAAIEDFCGASSWLADQSIEGPRKEYNTDNKNSLRLEMHWTGHFTMAADECRFLFQTIADGCDGNEPVFNPHNYKHGGRIDHPQGATLVMTPLSGIQPACEPLPYAGKNWIDRDAAYGAALEVCNSNDLNLQPGGRITAETTAAKTYSFKIGILSTTGAKITSEDCLAQFRATLDSCAGNDPINNPSNKKFGSAFSNYDGTVYSFWPLNSPPEFPPEAKDLSGRSITPHCDDGNGIFLSSADLETWISNYCVDGRDFGSSSSDFWLPFNQYYHLEIATGEVPAPEKVYPWGISVCRQVIQYYFDLRSSN